MTIELFLLSKTKQYRIKSELSFQKYRLAFIEIQNMILLGDFNLCMDDSPVIVFLKLANYVT